MTENTDYSAMSDEAFEASLEEPVQSVVEEAPSEPSDDFDDQGYEGTDLPAEGPQEAPEELEEASSFTPMQVGELEVKSAEEAQKLMALGIQNNDFVQKNQRIISTLQEHKIDEAKLNHLLDLVQGKPEAIQQLLKDHSIDPLDIPAGDENVAYTPSNNMVSESKMKLDRILDEIENTPAFVTTSEIVTKQWDLQSKEALFQNPEYLQELNTHVADGTYQKIVAEVKRAKIFGGLQNMSDFQAYVMVGKQLMESGALAVEPVQVSRQPKAPEANAERKRKAAPSRGMHSTNEPEDYDFSGMSDEAFEKLLNRGN